MKSLLRVLDYIFLVRPVLFFPGWATLLAGYYFVLDDQVLSSEYFILFPRDYSLLLLMIAFGCAMGGCFVLNQLQDVETDRQNKKLFFLGRNMVPVSHGYIESIFLLLLALLIGSYLTPQVFWSLFSFIMLTGIFYNYRPFILKSYPLRGLAANAMMGWLAFMVGWVLNKPIGVEMCLYSLPYFFYNASLCLLTTLPDVKGDAASQKITFPVKYGFVKTIWVSFVLMILALLGCIMLHDLFLLIITIFAIPFFIRLTVLQNVSSVILAIKTGLAFLALGVSCKFLPFLAIMIVTYFLTRSYYKKRFGLNYPTLGGA